MMTPPRSIVIALIGLTLAACGDGGGGHGSAARVPSPDELAGTYDLTTTLPGSSTMSRGVGTADGNLALTLSVPPVFVHGAIGADGTTALDGTNVGSDAIQFVHGHARVEAHAGVLRIVGGLDEGFESPATFTMERPVGADLRNASGRYRLTFTVSPSRCGCASTIDLALAIPAAGTGTAGDAPEVSGDSVVGSLSRTSIDVAPSGRFTMSGHYGLFDAFCGPISAIAGACALSLRGTLPTHAGESADADFVVQDGLTFTIAAGTVAITRLDTTP